MLPSPVIPLGGRRKRRKIVRKRPPPLAFVPRLGDYGGEVATRTPTGGTEIDPASIAVAVGPPVNCIHTVRFRSRPNRPDCSPNTIRGRHRPRKVCPAAASRFSGNQPGGPPTERRAERGLTRPRTSVTLISATKGARAVLSARGGLFRSGGFPLRIVPESPWDENGGNPPRNRPATAHPGRAPVDGERVSALRRSLFDAFQGLHGGRDAAAWPMVELHPKRQYSE